MSRLPKSLESLNPSAARKAIYIDFEGTKARPGTRTIPRPSLLGVLVDQQYTAYLLEEQFGPVTKAVRGFKGSQIEGRVLETDLNKVIRQLIQRAEAEGRLILYFSQHEQAVIKAHCDPDTSRDFRKVSANAKGLISKWAGTRPRQRKNHDKGLDDYCRLAGHPDWCAVPPVVGSRSGPAAAIRRLRKVFAKTRRWSQLKPEDQQLVRDFLKYNLADCWATRRLTTKAANALHKVGKREP